MYGFTTATLVLLDEGTAIKVDGKPLETFGIEDTEAFGDSEVVRRSSLSITRGIKAVIP